MNWNLQLNQLEVIFGKWKLQQMGVCLHWDGILKVFLLLLFLLIVILTWNLFKSMVLYWKRETSKNGR